MSVVWSRWWFGLVMCGVWGWKCTQSAVAEVLGSWSWHNDPAANQRRGIHIYQRLANLLHLCKDAIDIHFVDEGGLAVNNI